MVYLEIPMKRRGDTFLFLQKLEIQIVRRERSCRQCEVPRISRLLALVYL